VNNEQEYLAAKEVLALRGNASNKYGQIVRDFGKLPPAYLLASTPGPMKGGAPMYLGRQFTHGVMW
jgi:hypothetical protein